MSRDDPPPAMGPFLARSLKRRFGLEVKQIAGLIEAEEAEILGVLTGARFIRPEIALKLEKVFGVDAGQLMALQAEHDLAHAEAEPDVVWKLSRLRRISSAG